MTCVNPARAGALAYIVSKDYVQGETGLRESEREMEEMVQSLVDRIRKEIRRLLIKISAEFS